MRDGVYTYNPVQIYHVERCYKDHTWFGQKEEKVIQRTLSLNAEEYAKYLSGQIKRDYQGRAIVQKIETRNRALDELLYNCATSLGLNRTIIKQLWYRDENLITLMNFYMVFVESMGIPHGRNTSRRFRKVVKTLASTDYLNAISYLSERVESKEKVKELIKNLEAVPFWCFLPLYEAELERMSNMAANDIFL